MKSQPNYVVYIPCHCTRLAADTVYFEYSCAFSLLLTPTCPSQQMAVVVDLNPAHSQAGFEGYRLWPGAASLQAQTVVFRGHAAALRNAPSLAETSRAAAEAYGRHNHLAGVHWQAAGATQLLWWDAAGRVWAWTATAAAQQVRGEGKRTGDDARWSLA